MRHIYMHDGNVNCNKSLLLSGWSGEEIRSAGESETPVQHHGPREGRGCGGEGLPLSGCTSSKCCYSSIVGVTLYDAAYSFETRGSGR